jgi:hypothetical protein
MSFSDTTAANNVLLHTFSMIYPQGFKQHCPNSQVSPPNTSGSYAGGGAAGVDVDCIILLLLPLLFIAVAVVVDVSIINYFSSTTGSIIILL